jgi:hypothetical protein
MKLMDLNRHDGPVFYTRIVREPKDVPNNHILVLDLIIPGHHVGHATLFFL